MSNNAYRAEWRSNLDLARECIAMSRNASYTPKQRREQLAIARRSLQRCAYWRGIVRREGVQS